MTLAIALFVVGLLLFGAGLVVFEKYSPLNSTSKIEWQFLAGVLGMLLGAGLVFWGIVQWLSVRICQCVS